MNHEVLVCPKQTQYHIDVVVLLRWVINKMNEKKRALSSRHCWMATFPLAMVIFEMESTLGSGTFAAVLQDRECAGAAVIIIGG